MDVARIRKYQTLLRRSIRASETLHAYQRELSETCDHPTEYVADWEWEHDNGYGVQRRIKGKRCQICGATQAYADTSNWRKWHDSQASVSSA